jgi:hypothetical protein
LRDGLGLLDASANGRSVEVISGELEVQQMRRFSFKIANTRGMANVVLR